MEKQPTESVHYWIRSIILLIFLCFILYLVKTGTLMYYIAPRMKIFIQLAALGLFILSVSQAYLAMQSNRKQNATCDCRCGPPKSLKLNIWIYSLFLFPLLLGFLLPDTIMASNVASIKGINLTPMKGNTELREDIAKEPELGPGIPDPSDNENGIKAASTEKFQEYEHLEEFAAFGEKIYELPLISVNDTGFMEYLTTFSLYADALTGKNVELTGFVYREPDMDSNQFILSRLAVQCCSADATPYGIIVEDADANRLQKDAWVRIAGTIGKTHYNDLDVVKVNAAHIQSIDPPETPYVYPYVDNFSNLLK